MKRICVFCGSSPGAMKTYGKDAKLLGRLLAEKGIGLVYGGGKIGLMGLVARACLEAGGEVIGVMPKSLLDLELACMEISSLIIVGSMHERKAKMAELSEGFIALPGGLGTIEEFFEVLSWAQLGIHCKPCGILNTSRYYDRLLEFLAHAVEQRFIEAVHKDLMLIDETPEGLLQKFTAYKPTLTDKAAWALKLFDAT